MSGQQLWDAALAVLERKYSKPMYEMWFQPIRAVAMSENEIVLSVKSAFEREWLQNRLKGEISEVLMELHGAPIAIRFVVADEI